MHAVVVSNKPIQSISPASGGSSAFFATASAADYKASLEALASLQSNSSVLEEWTRRRQTNPDDTFAEETLQYARRMSLGSNALSNLSVIHVAGTKGKGSTCAFAESILRNVGGVKTGLYISPHLVEPTERIRIDGKPLTKEQFSKYFWKCWHELQASKTAEDSTMPGFFRFLTLMAFRVFLEEKVDVTILEVGIGGRTDATNVIEKPVVCGVTSIGYDHMDVLGDTLGKIGYEKAGIFKRDVPAFTVPQVEEAMQSFINVANRKQARLYLTPSMDQIEQFYGQSLKLGLDGSFQRGNAALALSLSSTWLSHHQRRPLSLPESLLLSSTPATTSDIESDIERFFGSEFNSNPRIAEALANTKWAGRCQTVETDEYMRASFGLNSTTIYLDGAHTPESSEVCSDWFAERTKEAVDGVQYINVLVFNCFASRDPRTLLRSYAGSGHFDYAFFVPVVRAEKTKTAMDQLTAKPTMTTTPTKMSWQEHTRVIWLELQSTLKKEPSNAANNYDEDPDRRALVLASLEEVMETLKSLEEESRKLNPHKEVRIRVLITGSIHLIGGVLGLLTERGVPDLL